MVRPVAERGHAIDWEKLGQTARLAVRFLDDVLEVGRWPDPRVEAATRRTRKVGLGVMGFAELLILLGVPYDSDEAAVVADEVMRCIDGEALVASHQLAHERGVFPAWEDSVYAAQRLRLRNAARTAIAPTGSISLIAGTSAGIEPLFALAYRRHVLGGQPLTEVNPLFLRHARRAGFYSESLVRQLQRCGSLAGLDGVPVEAQALFRTALEIAPEDQLRVQAAFQRHVDSAVAKTVNLPSATSPEEVTAIYRRAWELGLKGVTVYRYGSKGQQVLELGTEESPEEREHFAHCDPRACKV
jgi:ribonucleoside-diphosphate reductase alpha chain